SSTLCPSIPVLPSTNTLTPTPHLPSRNPVARFASTAPSPSVLLQRGNRGLKRRVRRKRRMPLFTRAVSIAGGPERIPESRAKPWIAWLRGDSARIHICAVTIAVRRHMEFGDDRVGHGVVLIVRPQRRDRLFVKPLVRLDMGDERPQVRI